jgi:cell division septation protein DedD
MKLTAMVTGCRIYFLLKKIRLCDIMCPSKAHTFLLCATDTNFFKTMRFCPKCSLKIKGTITQCPICKVELLSCAEDDEMDTRPPEDEQHPPLKSDAFQQPPDNLTASPADISRMKPGPVSTPAQPADHPDHSAIINSKLAKLEEHLKGIGKALNQHMGKEEILTRSLVELETKINKIEKSFLETAQSKESYQTPPAVVTSKDHDYSASQGGQATDTKPQRQPFDIDHSSTSGSAELSDAWGSARDVFAPGSADSEENPSFFSAPADGFEESTESEAMLSNDQLYRSGSERKKSFIIIIPVLCLLALCLFLIYYYNNLQKDSDRQLTITEPISLSSIPVDTPPIQPAPAGDVKPEPKPDTTDAPAPSPVTIPATDIKEDAATKTGIQDSAVKLPGGFTVSVGSFKEKKNAMDLTARLSKKGYAAQMAPLTQKKLFRVTVGAYAKRSDALAMASQLNKKEKLQTMIIDLNKP